MNKLVKILSDEDGDKIENPKWCLTQCTDGSLRTLCSGECFGEGEGRATYTTKEVKRGGITCEKCLEIIKLYKSIRL